LLGEAELQFFDLIALTEHVEIEGAPGARVLGELAHRYRTVSARVVEEPS
jgi:hypothetical protein